MNYLKQVQKGIDFIENNLDYDFSLAEVAQKTGISQWHFQRIFKALTNETLKTYIRSRRLAKALEKLLMSNCKIIDIALVAGFESQESFTRAFKNAFNMTPNQARKVGKDNLFLKKIKFDTKYLKHINTISLKPEIYTQKKMKLVGMKTEFYGIDSEKNNMAKKLPLLWNDFLSRIEEINDVISGYAYGIIQQTKERADLLEYFSVVEVIEDTHSNELPAGMVSLIIPETKYAKFTHKGKVQDINNTVNYIYSSWLMQSDERHTYGPDIEVYGDEYIPDSDDSVMYYSIPIEEH